MNWLTIVILIFLIIETLLGSKRGFFKSVLSLLAVVLAMFFTYYTSPKVAAYICNETDIKDVITERVEQTLANTLLEGGASSEESQSDDADSMESRSQQTDMLQQSGLPTYLQQVLGENSNAEFYRALGADTFVHYMAGYISTVIINILAYLVTYIALWLLLRIMANALGLVSRLPILHGLNRVGGAIFGFGKGLLIVTLVFLLITMFGQIPLGSTLFSQIETSPLLQWFYENNPLINLVLDITKQIF